MSDTPTPSPTAYALYRLANPDVGANEAARAVGYAKGRPTGYARRLHEKVASLIEMPEIADAVDDEITRLNKDIKRSKQRLHELKKKRQAQEEWKKAAKVLRIAEDQNHSSA